MIKNYFKIAWRNLVRHKMYSLINISGLSIGLASCMLIMLYAKDEVSYDHFHQNASDIYRIVVDESSPEGEINKSGITGMMQGPTFKGLIPEVENFARVEGTQFNIKRGTEIFTQDALKVDSSFFSIFYSFQFIEGSSKTALRGPADIVLSEEVAKKYFGEKSALGKNLEIDYDGEFKNFIVSGVTKQSPQNSSIKINLLMPYHVDKNQDKFWINFYLNTFLVLKKNSDARKVEEKMNKIFAIEAKEQLKEAKEEWNYNGKIKYFLQPFLDMHLSKDYTASNGLLDASNPTYSYILSGISILILIIACINFVNLTIARSLKRAKEIGVRKVIGGERKLLVLQFLGESLLLSLFAFGLSIVLVQLVLPLFNNMANKELSLSYLMDQKIILSYILLFLTTGLLAGFYPAIVLSGFKPVDVLYGKLKLSQGAFMQKGLVVFQFTLSGFLIIVTLISYSQFNFLLHKDLGYSNQNVVKVNTGTVDQLVAKTFSSELVKNSNIVKVAPHNQGSWFTRTMVNGKKEISNSMEIVDENYLPLLGLKIVDGRNFSADFPSDTSDAILVNEAYAKEANWKNPIGQTVSFYSREKAYRVVGIVKDYHFESLHQKIRPQLFLCSTDMARIGEFCVLIDPKNIPDAMAHIQKSFKSIFPTRPYRFEFETDANAKLYEQESKWKQIITFSAGLTIFISCIGLFGLAALSAEKRTKEIGIRKVLGASVNNIALMLIGNFFKLILLASLISFPIAWWVGKKLLEDYAYRIEISFWLFVQALFITSLLAFFTVGYQALKSALSNPVESLRTE